MLDRMLGSKGAMQVQRSFGATRHQKSSALNLHSIARIKQVQSLAICVTHESEMESALTLDKSGMMFLTALFGRLADACQPFRLPPFCLPRIVALLENEKPTDFCLPGSRLDLVSLPPQVDVLLRAL
jgi:hypothetical protein